MPESVTLDTLVVNFALLVAGVFGIGVTYRADRGGDSARWLAVRYLLTVLLGIYLTLHSVVLFGGMRFDFRAVVIALVARRHGVLPALLVAMPIGLYRVALGGGASALGLLHMALVAILGGAGTGWLRLHVPLQAGAFLRRWWTPFALFGTVNLLYFPAHTQMGLGWEVALPVYVTSVALGALGVVVAVEVLHSRLATLAHTTHLAHLAAVDSLTGCFNRRQFDADFLAPGRAGRAYLLVLDLDHFKRINDTYGHDAGDRVLVALADTLRATTRAADCLYRLGGEEFAVLLHGGTLADAVGIAQRVRGAVEVDLAGRAQLPGEQITLSGGLAVVQGDRSDVLRAADGHLYAAKEAGRNRIAYTGGDVSPSTV